MSPPGLEPMEARDIDKSRKRKLSSDSEVSPEKLSNLPNISNIKSEGIFPLTENIEHSFVVTNLPNSWNQDFISSYLAEICSFKKKVIIEEENIFTGSVKLYFDNHEQCDTARSKLQGVQVEGRNLLLKDEVKTEVSESEDKMSIETENTEPDSSKRNVSETKEEEENKDSVITSEYLDVDPSGMYGLKPSYLASLGIKPPIDCWVHVSNFRCDQTELRNVMELPGHIIIFSVFLSTKYAKVMYSHPLEAVQAVSMLHGQTFYGQTLKVLMIPNPGDILILPKGLSAIGPSLSCNKQPLRQVEKHFQRFIDGKPTALNKKYFRPLNNKKQFDKVEDGDIVKASLNVKKTNNLPRETTSSLNKTIDYKIEDSSKQKANKTNNDKDSKINKIDGKMVTPNEGSRHRKCSDTSESSSDEDRSKSSDKRFQSFRPKSENSTLCNSSTPKDTPSLQNNRHIETVNVRKDLTPQNPGPKWTPNYPARVPGPLGHMPVQNSGGARFSNNLGPKQAGPMGQIGQAGPMGTYRPMLPSGAMGSFGAIGQAGTMSSFGTMGQPRLPQPGAMGSFTAVGQSGPRLPSGAMGSRPAVPMVPNVMGPMVAGNPQDSEPVMLEFKNLPLSTTFSILCQKFADVGQVVSLQLTTPGCALVRFANMTQAQLCYQRFNNTFAEGNIIEVRFV